MSFLRPIAFCILVCTINCAKCDASKMENASADCHEDLDCFIARARTCSPAAVIHRATSTVTRYEIITKIGSNRCHIQRTQLMPNLRPDGGPIEENFEETLKPGYAPEPYKQNPHLMQCLYSPSQAAEVMERVKQGRATAADLDPCYPGDGSCGRLPHLAMGCMLDKCLLGRWIFDCEDRFHRNFQRCEGARLALAHPECHVRCVNSHEVLDCRSVEDTSAEWYSTPR